MQRFLREPLVHFLLLGGVLFAVTSLFGRRETSEAKIVVDKALEQRIATLYKAQSGRDPDAATLDRLVGTHIHDEILAREAKQLGLDIDDEIIRQRLVEKMQFVLEDASEAPMPDDTKLRTFFDQNPKTFLEPERVWFKQLYFRSDHDGESARSAAIALRDILNTTKRAPKPTESDPISLPSEFEDVSRDDVIKRFGDTAFCKALFTVSPGSWHGPTESRYGVHLFFVTKRKSATLPPFDTVRAQVVDEYQRLERARRNDAAFAAIAKRYLVVREPGK